MERCATHGERVGCSGSRKVGGHRELAGFWVGKVKSRGRGTSLSYFHIKDLLFPGQKRRMTVLVRDFHCLHWGDKDMS